MKLAMPQSLNGELPDVLTEQYLRNVLARLVTEVHDCTHRLGQVAGELGHVRTEFAGLSGAVFEMRNAIARAVEGVADIQVTLASMGDRVKLASDTASSADASGRHLHQELENLRELLAEKDAELREEIAKKDRADLVRRLAESEKENADHKKKVADDARDLKKRQRDLFFKVLGGAIIAVTGAFGGYLGHLLGVLK